MKSSTIPRSFRRIATAAATLALVLAAGCPGKTANPGTGGTGATTPSGPATGVTMSVTVNPADAQNRRSASVKFEAPAPVPDGQLTFELPKDCRILAGAAVRTVKNLGKGPVSQELAFECPAGTAGNLKATFKGTDTAGKPLEQVSEAPL